MPTVLARIDDRLIHGQVVVGWVRKLGCTRIAVVSDVVAANPLQRSMLPIAAPPDVSVEVLRVADFARDCASGRLSRYRLMALFTGPEEPLELLKLGVSLPSINVGGMRFRPGCRKICRSVSVSPREAEAFREIIDRGTRVVVQMVPSDPEMDMRSLLLNLQP